MAAASRAGAMRFPGLQSHLSLMHQQMHSAGGRERHGDLLVSKKVSHAIQPMGSLSAPYSSH